MTSGTLLNAPHPDCGTGTGAHMHLAGNSAILFNRDRAKLEISAFRKQTLHPDFTKRTDSKIMPTICT